MTVNVDDSDLRALRVPRVDENVPGCRHDHRRDTQNGGAPRMQPLVTGAAGRHLVLLPVAAESINVYGFCRNRIRRVDLKVLKRVRKVGSLYLDMYFHQGRGWIWGAVHYARSLRVPSARREQCIPNRGN